MIPQGNTIEDIREREQIIRDFYREWKERNPSQRKFNLSLKEYINIRMVSIVETSEHAAKSYLSTLAVLQLDSILTGAKRVSIKKPKPGNANQKPFERIMIMEYELTGIGKIKMTVGVRRRTLEKVNRNEKASQNEMLNFCPFCVAEVYALRCDAMRAGTLHYPLHRPTTTYNLCHKDM